MGKISFSALIFLALNCLSVFSQVNQVDAKGKKQGKWEKTYPESRAYEYKGQFKDDKPVGTFYYFYPSTKKKAIVVHDEKTSRSVANLYHESGVPLAFGIYKNQKKDSVWTHYGPSGKLSFKETYKDGKLNGKKTIYYVPELVDDKSQNVAMIENYVNDVKHGDVTEYFDDGTIKSTGKYENGIKVGKFITNHTNGKPMLSENYKNGKLHGYMIGYDETGKILGRRYYKNGDELRDKALEKWLKYCKDNKIDPNK
jgi:antitoxin component YwqK of YwqJK toxin-antitoxin module